MNDQNLQTIRKSLVGVWNIPNPTIHLVRSRFDALCERFADPNRLALEEVALSYCSATWLRPNQVVDTNKAILFFHGGAFSIGSTKGHLDFLNRLSSVCPVPILSVDYRHIPENPFPAGLEDCIEGYHFLLKEGYHPEDVAWLGFTSGGSLALSGLNLLQAKGTQLPSSCVCISPATDFLFRHTSIENVDKDWITEEKLQNIATLYGAGQDLKSPIFSPVYADLSELPPLLLQVGGDEILRGDIEYYATKAREAGTSVELSLWEDMIHCWPLFSSALASGCKSIIEAGKFIAHHFDIQVRVR